MYLAFINIHGNFDAKDSHMTAHPDFGGQNVYVKHVALELGRLGHHVDIITRRIIDPMWPEFAESIDQYPSENSVRIIRISCGPSTFLPKEKLWPHLGSEFAPNILKHYADKKVFPDIFTAHYADSGLCAAIIEEHTGTPYSFTAHALGAQKMDALGLNLQNIVELDDKYNFAARLIAERISMSRSAINITNSHQERYNQYAHRVYRDVIEIDNDDRFAIIPPVVAMEYFDKYIVRVSDIFDHEYVSLALRRDINPERLGLPCIIAASRIEAKKNHLGLVRAFAFNQELRSKANLVIFTNSDNPLNDRLVVKDSEQEIIDALLLEIDRYQLRGQISMFSRCNQEVLGARYRFFAKLHSVFILAALYEPFGLSVTEAMASGLPVVATKFGGTSEVLLEDNRSYGFLVDPRDPEDISAALLKLVSDPDVWQYYSNIGYERILNRYTWRHTAIGYLETLMKYMEVTHSSGGGHLSQKSSVHVAKESVSKTAIPSYLCNVNLPRGKMRSILKKLYF